MKTLFAFLVLCLPSFLFSFPFSEPHSGMQMDIPDQFTFCEDATCVSNWYTFIDENGNFLLIEIEESPEEETLLQHAHKARTYEGFFEECSVVFEGLDFKNLKIGQIDFTNLTLRLIAITETGLMPLLFSDYLCVHNGFKITVGIVKKGKQLTCSDGLEEGIYKMLESLTFSLPN